MRLWPRRPLLQATGYVSALPLAPQLVAPGAVGVFHDLRWVAVFHWSWFSLGSQLAAGGTARGAHARTGPR